MDLCIALSLAEFLSKETPEYVPAEQFSYWLSEAMKNRRRECLKRISMPIIGSY